MGCIDIAETAKKDDESGKNKNRGRVGKGERER